MDVLLVGGRPISQCDNDKMHAAIKFNTKAENGCVGYCRPQIARVDQQSVADLLY